MEMNSDVSAGAPRLLLPGVAIGQLLAVEGRSVDQLRYGSLANLNRQGAVADD